MVFGLVNLCKNIEIVESQGWEIKFSLPRMGVGYMGRWCVCVYKGAT